MQNLAIVELGEKVHENSVCIGEISTWGLMVKNGDTIQITTMVAQLEECVLRIWKVESWHGLNKTLKCSE